MKSIHVVESSLPIAWEKAVIACWEQGGAFPPSTTARAIPTAATWRP